MIKLTLYDSQRQKVLQEWTFNEASAIRIGRAPDNDVVLGNYAEVSRYHLELQCLSNAKQQWQLTSQGTNGTFLDGILVSKSLVRDSSFLQLAKDGPILQFQILQAPPPQPPVTPSSSACTHTGNPPTNLFCIHCGEPLVEQQRFVRQYQILRTLGQGGMGTTYLAWDKTGTLGNNPQLLVIKEMNANMMQIEKAQELFEREARILKSLRHWGIPKYYDFFVEAKKKYLAMELVHGQDLEKHIYQKGPVSLTQALQWMIQVCDILTYLHELDPPLVHRDVKPANLMVRNVDNRVILLDFGAVKEIGTSAGTRIGAEGYSAPEQDRGQPCPQSDLYAIGPTLIFLLTGQDPLKFYTLKQQGSLFDLSRIPTITPELRQVIERACEPKLNQRYAKAQDLSQALLACLT